MFTIAQMQFYTNLELHKCNCSILNKCIIATMQFWAISLFAQLWFCGNTFCSLSCTQTNADQTLARCEYEKGDWSTLQCNAACTGLNLYCIPVGCINMYLKVQSTLYCILPLLCLYPFWLHCTRNTAHFRVWQQISLWCYIAGLCVDLALLGIGEDCNTMRCIEMQPDVLGLQYKYNTSTIQV